MYTSEGELLKFRFNKNDQSSFIDPPYTDKTKLSEYIWQLNKIHIALDLECEVMVFTSPFKYGTCRCILCLIKQYLFPENTL